jgi:hypothetical protein
VAVAEGEADELGVEETLSAADADACADLEADAEELAGTLGKADGDGYSALQVSDSAASMFSAAAVPTM